MHTQQHQLFALLVAGASAVSAIPAEEKRDLKECGDAAMELLQTLTSVPTPDLSLVEQLASQTQLATVTDACAIPAVTGAPASAYSSWMSDLSSWQLAHTDELNSLFDACSDVPEIAESLSMLPGGVTVCSEITWESPSGSPSASPSASLSASPSASSSASATGDNNGEDDQNDDNSSNDDNDSNNDNDDADSDNSNNEGGNGGNAASRETGTVAALAAVAMAGLISAVM